MGIFKAIGWFVTGGAVRPTTTRERSRMYQRRANNLLEEQLNVMQNLAQQQQFTQLPTDARPRGTCPACMEFMLVGASTCPNCHTTGITWPSTPDRCPNCVLVIPFGTTTCPNCHTTGITWPTAPAPTTHSHSHSVQSSSSTVFSYNPNPHTARKTKSAFVLKNEERQREAERAAGPEVWKLREEISKVAQRRDKMRQKLKGDTNTLTCSACNEKLPTGQSDCFNCQYKELRKKIDDLTKPT